MFLVQTGIHQLDTGCINTRVKIYVLKVSSDGQTNQTLRQKSLNDTTAKNSVGRTKSGYIPNPCTPPALPAQGGDPSSQGRQLMALIQHKSVGFVPARKGHLTVVFYVVASMAGVHRRHPRQLPQTLSNSGHRLVLQGAAPGGIVTSYSFIPYNTSSLPLKVILGSNSRSTSYTLNLVINV